MTVSLEPMPARIDQQQVAQDLVDAARTDGVELIGLNGVLAGVTKSVLETALDAEVSEHLGCDKHDPMGRNRGTPATAPIEDGADRDRAGRDRGCTGSGRGVSSR